MAALDTSWNTVSIPPGEHAQDNGRAKHGDTLTIQSVTPATDGAVAIDGDTVTYTPDPDFNGTVAFTYTVADKDTTDTATVYVTVLPVNDAPIAADDVATTDEDTEVAIAVLDNDTDIEDPDALFVEFMGRAPDSEALLERNLGTLVSA